MKIWKDFKEFAFKGNVMDMAIGVIIGGAFGKIVASVVENIITPLISLLTGNTSFNDLMWVLKDGTLDAETGEMVGQVAIKYGAFIQTVIDFFLIAVCIFIMVKVIKGISEKAKKKKEEAPAEEEEKKPTTEELLTEVVAMMKKDRGIEEDK